MIRATVTEVHKAIITDNVDPEQRGRLKVRCDTLAGPDTELPDWVEPRFPYLSSSNDNTTDGGWFFVPDIGVVIEIEITVSSARDETPEAISFDAPDLRWRACVIAPGEDSVGSEFKGDSYPKRRGVQTGAGHAIVFDDDALLVQLIAAYRAGRSILILGKDGAELDVDLLVVRRGTNDTQVIIEGIAKAFSTALADVMTEIIAIGAGIPAGLVVPAPNAALLKTALSAGIHTANRLKTE